MVYWDSGQPVDVICNDDYFCKNPLFSNRKASKTMRKKRRENNDSVFITIKKRNYEVKNAILPCKSISAVKYYKFFEFFSELPFQSLINRVFLCCQNGVTALSNKMTLRERLPGCYM